MIKKTNFFDRKDLFVAEISANHNGSIKIAKKLISTAKKYGADAVKLQTYTPNTITIKSPRKDFLIKDGLWKGKTLWELYNAAQTPFEWHKELFKYAKKINIPCFSSPFDESAVDLLESLNCPFYKIASFELNHLPLIKKIAKTKKPIIISTGTSNLQDIDQAFFTAKKFGSKDIIILYCVSNYPTKLEDFNFNNIKILKKRYKCKVGFSDHSKNDRAVATAIASGAELVEKHIALDKQKKGFDIAFSLKGKEIKRYIQIIKETRLMMGKEEFFRSKSEVKNRIFRRSIFTIKNIKKGEKISKQNIKIIRPATGIEPMYYEKILNKKSPYKIKSGSPLSIKFLKSLKIKIEK